MKVLANLVKPIISHSYVIKVSVYVRERERAHMCASIEDSLQMSVLTFYHVSTRD